MKFAALVLAYKEPEMVNKLLEQLLHEFGEDIRVFIHVSRGSEYMIETLLNHPQIEILPMHLGIDPKELEKNKNKLKIWAGDGLIRRMMYMFNYVTDKCNADYYIVLSGQDLIVRKGIKQFYLDNRMKIFMDGGKDNANQGARLLYKWPIVFFKNYHNKYHPLRILRRVLLLIYSTGIKINRQKNADLFDNVELYKNFYWMSLPAECVKFLIEYEKNNPEIMEVYYSSICPEESFFSTVLANQERFHDMFNWIQGTSNYKGVTYFKKFDTAFPMIEESDIELIENSEVYFAKKFSISYNESLVDHFYKRIMEA